MWTTLYGYVITIGESIYASGSAVPARTQLHLLFY